MYAVHDRAACPDRGWAAQVDPAAAPGRDATPRVPAQRQHRHLRGAVSLRPGRSGRHGEQRRCGGGLRAQPEPLSSSSLEAEATQRCQSQAKDTDGSGSGAGRQRGRRLGQMPGMATEEGGIRHPGAIGQHLQRGHCHDQPVPVHACWVAAAGAMPIPAFPLEDAKALFNPDPQPTDFQRDRGRRLIREQDSGSRHLRAPHGHQGAAAPAPGPKGHTCHHAAVTGLGHLDKGIRTYVQSL